MKRIKQILLLLSSFVLLSSIVAAQENDPAERNARWKTFTKYNFDKFDFTKTKLTKARLNRLVVDETVDDFALLRGVVFGKRGRTFKERSIQEYLDKQAWYKPKPGFSNKLLTRMERANLDIIRLAEAEKHTFIEPGDMRIWQSKLITDDNIRGYSPAELTILISEIEAIHGKTFSDEWIQKYFDERYWYKRNPAYTATVLNETERKNMERLIAEKEKGRGTALAIGDMDNFQNVLLTEDKLAGLSMLELRIIREEFWARRGKKFDVPGIRQYFEWRDWYKPLKNQKLVKLSKIEEQNVVTIWNYEGKIREKLSTEVMSDDAIGDLFAEDLRVLRNEIYARRGRVFKDKELQKFFDAQAWYKPNPEFKDEMLGEVEIQNLAKIRLAEESAISKFSEFEG
jgi:hypothetical protein